MMKKMTEENGPTLGELSEKLTYRQELFCQLYLADRECFCNATKSYMTAYNLTLRQYGGARVSAYRLITNANILAYLKRRLDEQMNGFSVDLELARVVAQNKDLIAKMVAINLYNRMKGRVSIGKIKEIIHPEPIINSM